MRRFKYFLLSEAYTIGIVDPNEIPDVVSNNQNSAELFKLFSYLKRLSNEDIVLIANEKGIIKIRRAYMQWQSEIKEWMKKNTPNLTLGAGDAGFGNGSVGSGGRKINESTQEFMVAALCLLNKKLPTKLSLAEAISVINEAKGKFASIEGSGTRPELLDQFNDNFDDLATAISSANSINDIVGTVSKVYQTGKTWHSDIKKYNPPVGGIRDYNSSDIVVKGADGIFYGFSLKKKGKSIDVDPTLINKPITGSKSLLIGILGSKELAKIEESKENFFDNVIWKYHDVKTSKLSNKEKGKLISEIPNKKMGEYLKDTRNVFFRRVDSVLSGYAEEFCKKFIELLFRTQMKDIEDSGEFKFYLSTGIGKKTGDSITVESAETKDLPHTMEVITNIFSSKVSLKKTPGKLNAWETDTKTGKKSGAAKIFYTIFSKENPIIDIEIRYKGSYTANPQFQAVATPVFKNLFKT